MIPALGEERTERRLALPFLGGPLIKPSQPIGINPYTPLFPMGKRLTFEIPRLDSAIPAQEVASTKGYFFGGLIPRRETQEEFLARNPMPKSIRERINDFGNEHQDLIKALLAVYK
jgi:hypothetical protein